MMNGDDFCLSFFEKKLSGDCQILNANLVFSSANNNELILFNFSAGIFEK